MSILKLRVFYFIYYGLQGILIPFLPLWFNSKGLSNSYVGLIIALSFLPKIISNPVLAYFVDTVGKLKIIIISLVFISIILFNIYPYVISNEQYMIIALLVNLIIPTIIPLIDRMAIDNTKNKSKITQFSTIRVYGSIGFAFTTLVGGKLINILGDSSIGLIERYQKRGGKGTNKDILNFNSVDFVSLAKANGMDGIFASDFNELDSILKKRDLSKPLLIEINLEYSESDEFMESF